MMMRLRTTSLLIWIVAASLLIGGCARYPQDPHQSLDRALTRGTLRVGVLRHEPWVTGAPPDAPGGVEAELIQRFAQDMGIGVSWRWGNSEDLFEALEHYELDVLIGGLTSANPWGRHVTMTTPYFTNHVVVALPPGVTFPDGSPAPAQTPALISRNGGMLEELAWLLKRQELDGVTVAVRPQSSLQETLRGRSAVVVERADLAGADGPIAAEGWEVLGLGFQPTGADLETVHYVLAVPPGENALLVRLEKTLLHDTTPAHIAERLWEESRR